MLKKIKTATGSHLMAAFAPMATGVEDDTAKPEYTK